MRGKYGWKRKVARRVCLLVLGLSLLPSCLLAGERLQVLTSFSPDFYMPIVAAFEAAHPEIRVTVLNKKTTAAMAEIQRGNPRRFDIFWSSSQDAFEILKETGALMPAPVLPGAGLPRYRVPGLVLEDPEGFYRSFALSGFGWVWNREYMEREGLAVPASWTDLEDPGYYGHIAMTTPSRSGTTHLIVESLLQDLGWEAGWGLIFRMAGNLSTISARSFRVSEGVEQGRFGVGLVIDFLARPQDGTGFLYGNPAMVVPAGIARLQNGSDAENARRFESFVLSQRGQSVLLDPAVNRLPVVRLDPRTSPNARELARRIDSGRVRAFDVALSMMRYNLVNHLFDQMVTYIFLERRKLWKRYVALSMRPEARRADVAAALLEIRGIFGRVPVTEAESLSPDYNARFSLTRWQAGTDREAEAELERWKAEQGARFSRIANRLAVLEQGLGVATGPEG